MSTRCDYRISTQERKLEIESPQERLLPGRMLREMVRNLETRYELYEYSLIKSEKQASDLDDVVAVIPLAGLGLQKGKQIVIQRLHPSLYDPSFYQLTPDEMDDYAQSLEPGEEMVAEDFTVVMPADYYIMVTDDVKRFARVATHLKLSNLQQMAECVSRLCCAGIIIQDEALMMVDYNDDSIPDLMARNCGEYLREPSYGLLTPADQQ